MTLVGNVVLWVHSWTENGFMHEESNIKSILLKQ